MLPLIPFYTLAIDFILVFLKSIKDYNSLLLITYKFLRWVLLIFSKYTFITTN